MWPSGLMLLSVIASTSSRATKRSPNRVVQVAAASVVRAAGRAATSTALRTLFTSTEVGLVCRAVTTVVPNAMIGASTPRRARYKAPSELCELMTTLCSGRKCGVAASNTARWPNPGTVTTTAIAPAIASAQVGATSTGKAPSIAPVERKVSPPDSAAVREPDGDHRTGTKPRCASKAALAKPIDPAPRTATLAPVIGVHFVSGWRHGRQQGAGASFSAPPAPASGPSRAPIR